MSLILTSSKQPGILLKPLFCLLEIRAQAGDFGEVRRLMKILERPYDEQPEYEADADFPPDWAQHIEVSCSS